MSVTAYDLAQALHLANVGAKELSPVLNYTSVSGVNVWPEDDPGLGIPGITVWLPFHNYGYRWGPNFEFSAPANTSLDELVKQIISTMPLES